jgi:hypothetical protein
MAPDCVGRGGGGDGLLSRPAREASEPASSGSEPGARRGRSCGLGERAARAADMAPRHSWLGCVLSTYCLFMLPRADLHLVVHHHMQALPVASRIKPSPPFCMTQSREGARQRACTSACSQLRMQTHELHMRRLTAGAGAG